MCRWFEMGFNAAETLLMIGFHQCNAPYQSWRIDLINQS
jgi:hypothetical protein